MFARGQKGKVNGESVKGCCDTDNRERTAPPLAAAELGRVTAGYQLWLVRQPLSPNTAGPIWVGSGSICAYLRASGNDYGNPLSDLHARDYAIHDFKSHLKKSCKAKPASVNLTLAALDNLYLFLGPGRPNVRREDLPKEAPRALEPEEQKRFMRAVERCTSIRDRAIAQLLFYTALRVGECASLGFKSQRKPIQTNKKSSGFLNVFLHFLHRHLVDQKTLELIVEEPEGADDGCRSRSNLRLSEEAPLMRTCVGASNIARFRRTDSEL
jgi:hypothetical protein